MSRGHLPTLPPVGPVRAETGCTCLRRTCCSLSRAATRRRQAVGGPSVRATDQRKVERFHRPCSRFGADVRPYSSDAAQRGGPCATDCTSTTIISAPTPALGGRPPASQRPPTSAASGSSTPPVPQPLGRPSERKASHCCPCVRCGGVSWTGGPSLAAGRQRGGTHPAGLTAAQAVPGFRHSRAVCPSLLSRHPARRPPQVACSAAAARC